MDAEPDRPSAVAERDEDGRGHRSDTPARGRPLQLLRQARLRDLVARTDPGPRRLEASGVTLEGGTAWVAFDNLASVVGVDVSLTAPDRTVVVHRDGAAPGYEDITADATDGSRYLAIEATRTPGGTYRPQIDHVDPQWRLIARRWVRMDLDRPTKGLEGLACVRRGGRAHLLALTEGREPRVHGRRAGKAVHVLALRGDAWEVVADLRLPTGLDFRDHSALGVRDRRIAVVSQESAAMWVGELDPHRWSLTGPGRVHPFPRGTGGRTTYGTVEGVSWLDDRTIVAVSDRPKHRHHPRFRRTADSLHVFSVPALAVHGAGPEAAAGRPR